MGHESEPQQERESARDAARGLQDLLEAAIDIGMTAGNLLTTNRIVVDDSRVMVGYIRDIAQKFEDSSLRDSEDYIGEIDNYAEHFLLKRFGSFETPCSAGTCGHPEY